MSTETTQLTSELYQYLIDHGVRESPLQRRLREETAAHPEAQMQISPEQGQFMALLVKLMGAVRTLEVGVFTGYSSLSVALALPDDGLITACDLSDEYTATARRYWSEAGVLHKIELRLGQAADTLKALLEEGRADTYDFAFIDADKEQYDVYFELTLRLLRPGGLVMLDNVFRGGKVAIGNAPDPATSAMRALNRKLIEDDRIDVCMLPVSDGVTLALKRSGEASTAG